MTNNELMEAMSNPPPLHPELKPYLCKLTHFQALRHPLVFAVPYSPFMNHQCNQCYEFKTKSIQEAKEKKNWNSYIFLHERPYRWDAFLRVMDEMSDEDYWKNLGGIWSDTENLWQVQNILPYLLESKRDHRDKVMDEEETAFLADLPDEFMVFRGHHYRNRTGYSWSLSFWRAQWFAHRFAPKKKGVIMGRAKKSDVIGVFLGRNEWEIAIDPRKLQNIKPIKKLQHPAPLAIILTDAEQRFKLHKTSSYHGLWHWEKVERNTIALCKLVHGADLLVCRLFAILHDAERLNENDDPKHGFRAAGYVEKRLLTGSKVFNLKTILTTDQIDKLLKAIRDHNDGKVIDDPTVGVCWDSDRLDLSRVGIVPDPNLLSTEAAKKLVWGV